MTTFETQDRKWHTSRGSGPNHILKLVIPHTIIPYKAPLKMIKKKRIKISMEDSFSELSRLQIAKFGTVSRSSFNKYFRKILAKLVANMTLFQDL